MIQFKDEVYTNEQILEAAQSIIDSSAGPQSASLLAKNIYDSLNPATNTSYNAEELCKKAGIEDPTSVDALKIHNKVMHLLSPRET